MRRAVRRMRSDKNKRALSLIGRVPDCQSGWSQFESGRARYHSSPTPRSASLPYRYAPCVQSPVGVMLAACAKSVRRGNCSLRLSPPPPHFSAWCLLLAFTLPRRAPQGPRRAPQGPRGWLVVAKEVKDREERRVERKGGVTNLFE